MYKQCSLHFSWQHRPHEEGCAVCLEQRENQPACPGRPSVLVGRTFHSELQNSSSSPAPGHAMGVGKDKMCTSWLSNTMDVKHHGRQTPCCQTPWLPNTMLSNTMLSNTMLSNTMLSNTMAVKHHAVKHHGCQTPCCQTPWLSNTMLSNTMLSNTMAVKHHAVKHHAVKHHAVKHHAVKGWTVKTK